MPTTTPTLNLTSWMLCKGKKRAWFELEIDLPSSFVRLSRWTMMQPKTVVTMSREVARAEWRELVRQGWVRM